MIKYSDIDQISQIFVVVPEGTPETNSNVTISSNKEKRENII
jgi:hypothetical protein